MTFYSLTNKHEFTLQGDFVGARKGAVAPVTVVNEEKRPAGLSCGEKTIDNMCTGHASVCYMLHIISVSIRVQHINKGSWFKKCHKYFVLLFTMKNCQLNIQKYKFIIIIIVI